MKALVEYAYTDGITLRFLNIEPAKNELTGKLLFVGSLDRIIIGSIIRVVRDDVEIYTVYVDRPINPQLVPKSTIVTIKQVDHGGGSFCKTG